MVEKGLMSSIMCRAITSVILFDFDFGKSALRAIVHGFWFSSLLAAGGPEINPNQIFSSKYYLNTALLSYYNGAKMKIIITLPNYA